MSTGEIEGIAEIKCLKILRTRTVSEVFVNLQDSHQRKTLNQQCFKIVGDKLILKHSHSYYYQVQFQLLITGFSYCDFILHNQRGHHLLRGFSQM